MGHSLRHPYIPRSTTEAFFCNSYPGYRLTTYSGDVSCQRLTLTLEPTGLCKCPNCGNFCKPHATLYRDIRCAPCLGYPYPENRGIYTQSDSSKKSSRNIWSLAVVSVDQRY